MKRIYLNDSGIHPEWGEGPESAEELEDSEHKPTKDQQA